jgi:hypothetical protein
LSSLGPPARKQKYRVKKGAPSEGQGAFGVVGAKKNKNKIKIKRGCLSIRRNQKKTFF